MRPADQFGDLLASSIFSIVGHQRVSSVMLVLYWQWRDFNESRLPCLAGQDAIPARVQDVLYCTLRRRILYCFR